MYECRCDERLQTKGEESTCLTYTGFLVELEHLKIKTTLIDEMFASVMGEYVFLRFTRVYYKSKARAKKVIGAPSIFKFYEFFKFFAVQDGRYFSPVTRD